MAYSNWGAFVHKDGERRRDREDVGVFDTDEANIPTAFRIFYNIMKNREKYGDDRYPWHKHSHHAVLGDGPVRMCGYKRSPELWVMDEEGNAEQIKLPEPDYAKKEWDISREGKLEVVKGVYTWKFHQYDEDLIDLELIEPDGTVWKSTCGYEIGAGFVKDPRIREPYEDDADLGDDY